MDIYKFYGNLEMYSNWNSTYGLYETVADRDHTMVQILLPPKKEISKSGSTSSDLFH